jgi:hypothetical protein
MTWAERNMWFGVDVEMTGYAYEVCNRPVLPLRVNVLERKLRGINARRYVLVSCCESGASIGA